MLSLTTYSISNALITVPFVLPTYLFVLRSYLFVCHKRFLLHPVNNVHLHTDARIIFVNTTVFPPTPTRYNECCQQTLLLFLKPSNGFLGR